MNFLDIAKTRYSVRSYKDKRVEKEKLEQILEAAHVAPTAANLQPVRLLVVQEKEGLDKISEAANIYSAPLAIIVCSDHCSNNSTLSFLIPEMIVVTALAWFIKSTIRFTSSVMRAVVINVSGSSQFASILILSRIEFLLPCFVVYLY